MKWLAAAIGALALVSACGDDSDGRSAPSTAPSSPIATTEPPAPVIDEVADDAAAPAPLPPPQPVQLPQVAPHVQFLGWTEDGRQFALRTTYGSDLEDIGGQNLLGLIQIHAAESGDMIDSFRVRRVTDDSVRKGDRYSKAWRQARPRAEWRQFRAEHPLAGRDPSTVAPAGGTALAVELDGEMPHDSSLAIEADEAAHDLRWTGFDRRRLQGPMRQPPPRPRLRVLAVAGDQPSELLAYRLPWDYDQINAARNGGEPALVGTVAAHWSPAGDRVVIVASHAIENANEEHGELTHARWFLRDLTQ